MSTKATVVIKTMSTEEYRALVAASVNSTRRIAYNVHMSIRDIKQQILPPSSKSFHHFENYVNHNIQALSQDNKRILESLDSINGILQSLRSSSDVSLELTRLYGSATFGLINGGDSFESDMSLFQNLPQAYGNRRLNQLVAIKLMAKLDKLLTNNNIRYWINYGALLGAYTRGRFIPWDDDIDICILRDDLDKLLEIMKEETGYRVMLVYDRYAFVTQYRFCAADENIPTFIDLCIWDYATSNTPENNSRLKQFRVDLVRELDEANLPYWKKQKLIFKPGCGNITSEQCLFPDDIDEDTALMEIGIIQGLFDKYNQLAVDEGILLKRNSSKARANAYAYSLNNLTEENRDYIFDKSIITPTKKIMFEGINISGPNDPKVMLDGCYNNWPKVPSDESVIGSRHFNFDLFNDPSIRGAAMNFLTS